MKNLLNKKFNILDQGWVELQDVMGDDLAIVAAARTSYLGESKGKEQDKKLLFYLMEHRHDGPFEMVSFRFRVHAPEVVWRQLVRHRTGKFNLQSYRYTSAQEEAFYQPSEWRLQSKANKQGSDGVLDEATANKLSEALYTHYKTSHVLYQQAIEAGVARELARLFLPGFALYSIGVVKFDARNLMHFLSLRMAEEAQYEIRQVANAMWTIFEEVLPWTAEAYKKFRR